MYYFTFKKCFEDQKVFTKKFFEFRHFVTTNEFHYIEVPIHHKYHVPVTRRLYECKSEEDLNYFLTIFTDIAQRVKPKSNTKMSLEYLERIRQ